MGSIKYLPTASGLSRHRVPRSEVSTLTASRPCSLSAFDSASAALAAGPLAFKWAILRNACSDCKPKRLELSFFCVFITAQPLS